MEGIDPSFGNWRAPSQLSYFESREEALKFACEQQPSHHKAILIEGPGGALMDEHEIELQCADIHR